GNKLGSPARMAAMMNTAVFTPFPDNLLSISAAFRQDPNRFITRRNDLSHLWCRCRQNMK
ncbi:hypothetical protein N9381_08425, partial [Paracoccaceae bacterium]|nr:hypothetical protein [Paracoccaceae bacterium]